MYVCVCACVCVRVCIHIIYKRYHSGRHLSEEQASDSRFDHQRVASHQSKRKETHQP